jgi:type I restriction enzyme M protein
VPPEARWSHLKAQAKQTTIGQLVDDAMAGIERDNPSLKGVLPQDYARPALDKQRLGQLIEVVTNIRIGDTSSRSRDVLGEVYGFTGCRVQQTQSILYAFAMVVYKCR